MVLNDNEIEMLLENKNNLESSLYDLNDTL